jgi:hypothetical protein
MTHQKQMPHTFISSSIMYIHTYTDAALSNWLQTRAPVRRGVRPGSSSMRLEAPYCYAALLPSSRLAPVLFGLVGITAHGTQLSLNAMLRLALHDRRGCPRWLHSLLWRSFPVRSPTPSYSWARRSRTATSAACLAASALAATASTLQPRSVTTAPAVLGASCPYSPYVYPSTSGRAEKIVSQRYSKGGLASFLLPRISARPIA